MDSKEHNRVIAFDTLFSTNHIQMMKVLLPYLDNQMQKTMAVYIKYLEFNYTLDFFKKHPYPVCGCLNKEDKSDFGKMCCDLLPYCNENERKKIEQFQGIFKSMEMYQEMSKTMDMMKDFMPNMNAETGNQFDAMQMMMNMLSPEQQELFELFGGNNHAE